MHRTASVILVYLLYISSGVSRHYSVLTK